MTKTWRLIVGQSQCTGSNVYKLYEQSDSFWNGQPQCLQWRAVTCTQCRTRPSRPSLQ